MKKITLLILVFCCWTSFTQAQIHLGIKGGLNFAKFNTDDMTLDNATGWQAGLLLQFKVPIIGLGLQPELLYSVKKADVDGQSNSIGYFEIPVNIRWAIELPLIRPYILVGPYFSYAADFSGDAFKNGLDRFDWGIGLGGGVEIWKIQIGIRYSWGLQNISSVDDFKLKNNTFSLSAAFLF